MYIKISMQITALQTKKYSRRMCFRVFFFLHAKTNIAINRDAMTESGLRCAQYTATGPAHMIPHILVAVAKAPYDGGQRNQANWPTLV
jgi:hypothetical protein